MKYTMIVIFLVWGIMACESFFEKEVVFPIDAELKLVAVGVLDPDDILKIHVSHTQNVDEKKLSIHRRIVKDAHVVISELNGSAIELSFSEDYDAYVDSKDTFKVQAGKTYTLSVERYGYPTLSAKCTVPAIYPDSAELSYRFREDEFGELEFIVLKKNLDYHPYNLSLFTLEFIEDNNGEFKLFRRSLVDILPKNVMNIPYVEFRSFSLQKNTIVVVAYTDDAYYKYHESFKNQMSAQENIFSEAINLYTNINGGYGVFCGITGTSVD